MVATPGRGPQAAGGEPYVGLRAYDSTDRSRFFGRQREALEVSALWLGTRLVVLHGPSGVGKTSLIQAGVLPLLENKAEVLPVGRLSRGSPFPTSTLTDHNPYTFALLSSWSPADPPTRLSGMSIAAFLRERPGRLDKYGDRLPILAVIDQFEGIFNDFPHRARYRDEFFEGLAAAVRELPHLRILISVREDSLAPLLPYEDVIARHSRCRFRLEPFTPEAALEAARRPLENTGRSFIAGVAEEMVTSLRTVQRVNSIGETTEVVMDRVEPVQLQVVCSALWRGLPPTVREITYEHVRDYGDIDRTLADFCATAIGEVAAEYHLIEPELSGWLEHTFVTELGTRGTVYEGLRTTGGMPNEIAQALEERRILTVEWRSGSRWYELQHDRLIEPIRRINRPWTVIESPTPEPAAADYLRAAESALADGELSLAEKRAIEAKRACGPGETAIQAEVESFLGHLAEQRDQPDEALRYYRLAAGLFEVLGDRTAVGRLLGVMGSLLLAQGQYAAAAHEWQGAVERLPGDLDPQIELARAFGCSGQLGPAVGVYTSVLTVAPESARALAGRGQILADRGEATEGLADLWRLTELHPEYATRPEIRSARALAWAGVGRLDEAESEMDQTLAAAPGHGLVLLRAAKLARGHGESERARELAERALAATGPALLPYQADEARRLLRASR